MKKFVFITLILIGFISCSSDDSTTESLTESLTQIEKDDLLTLREEEKLARDVYLFAYDMYGLDISNSISQSEQTHMDKILDLLNTYNIEDPALPNRGEFNNQTLQNLYNDLTTQVSLSELDALKVGAIIEDLDIRDIEEFESRTDKSDILNVYDKLKCGSRNHMRSYYTQLLGLNFTYSAQFITAEELIEIITSGNEQCGNN